VIQAEFKGCIKERHVDFAFSRYGTSKH